MTELLRRASGRPGTAAQWFAARRVGAADPATELAFAEWLAADPEHQRQYALCEIAWDLSGPAAAELPRSPTGPRSWMAQPGRAARLGLGVAASLLVVMAALWWKFPTPTTALVFATGAGEQQEVLLSDGSRVTLNTRTEIEVELAGGARQVRLKRGEAFFDVAHDESRPFHVLTSLGDVRVVGTRFSVYQRPQSLEVSTEQGLVRVHGAATADRTDGLLVPPGNQAIIAADDPRPRLGRADLERIRNWRRKLLEFDSVPLSELLQEFSRYTTVPIRPASDELGSLRVSGVFHTGDVTALSQALQSAFGLKIRRSDKGELVVERAIVGRAPTKVQT